VLVSAALANRAEAETRLILQSRKLLRDNGFRGEVTVVVQGRRCMVTGSVDSEPVRQAVMAALRPLRGIDQVDGAKLIVARRDASRVRGCRSATPSRARTRN